MAVLTQYQCYHCGDDCTLELTKDDKKFCCNGCLNVYTILSNGGLNAYYKLNQFPGANQNKEPGKFNYLDNEEIASKLISYTDDQKTIVTFYIPTIHCSSCIWLLEHLNTINPAIVENRVDFLKKQVYIQFNHHQSSLKQLVELLDQIGYEPLISLQDVVQKDIAHKDNLVTKIAVAGFCFGNVMLLSFPAYFGLSAAEESYGRFFSLLSILFSLPAVFYSGLDYFKRAFYSLKQKNLNIDFPLALGIAVLLLRTLSDYILNTGEGFADSLTGLIFFLLIGRFVQQKTYHHLSFERDYKSFFPVAVDVIDAENNITPIALEKIKIGDRILVKNQEIIPADAILLKGNALIDFSFVTGESQPIKKVWGEIIYAGGKQTSGVLELEVVKPVSQSYLTGLWNNATFHKNTVNRTKTFVDKVSHHFSIVLLLLATITFLYWLPQNWQTGLNAFTAILIIACPCALALSTPFTMSAALRIFDKNKFYLKNTAVVEHLAAIDTLVFDKTGTITLTNKNEMSFIGELSLANQSLVYQVCNQSSHPLSRKICEYLASEDKQIIEDFKEITGYGLSATFQNKEILIGSANFVLGAENGYESNCPSVHISINNTYLGYFIFEQKIRPGFDDVLRQLKSNYQTFLLSGDQKQELALFQKTFHQKDNLFFNQTPQNKLDFVLHQQQQNRKVLMLGDGLNDAGALKQSDVGIAITDNINNFTPGSDAILDGKSLIFLPNFIAFSKACVKIIHISFCIAIVYNVVGISFAIQGKLSPLIAAILMPVSTLTIISFTSIASYLSAIKYHLKKP